MSDLKTNVEDCRKERIERYKERITDNPRYRTQLLIKDGKAILVLEGKVQDCIQLEGYIRLSSNDDFVPIDQGEFAFFMLPKNKMIIEHEERYEFLGYKTNNTEGCILMLHAATEQDDIVIVKVDDDIPVMIAVDMIYDEGKSFNILTYQMLDFLMSKVYPRINSNDGGAMEDDDNEWE